MIKRKSTFTTVCLFVLVYKVIFSTLFIDMLTLFSWRDDCLLGPNGISLYFAGPSFYNQEDFLEVLKENYLIPPPSKPNTTQLDFFSPTWKGLFGDWIEIQKLLQEVFKNEPPGKFVEIGAGNGEFVSETLYLERKLGWTGLLIEPDPRSFKELTKIGRNAWLSPLCVSQKTPVKQRFLIQPVREDLPGDIRNLILSRSKLDLMDRTKPPSLWETIWVPCTPLSLVLTAVGLQTFELLSVSGISDTLEVSTLRDVLQSKSFDVKTLLLQFPSESATEIKYPQVKGYVADVGRSMYEVKFYIKKTYCDYLQETCDQTKACYNEYTCFGYLQVFAPKNH